jgi:hypothetical protein
MSGLDHYSNLRREGRLRRTNALFLFLFVLMPTGAGASIYTLWRSTSLLVFQWYGWAGLGNAVFSLRSAAHPWRNLMPGLLLYSVPDAIWVYSFTSLLLLIWADRLKYRAAFAWIAMPLILGLGGEICQIWHIVPGTFDWWDVGSYITASLLSCITGLMFFRLFPNRPEGEDVSI